MRITWAFLAVSILLSCSKKQPLVSKSLVDTLYQHYTPDSLLGSNRINMKYWKGRINLQSVGNVNESQYAATLVKNFQLAGHIGDVKEAFRIYQHIDSAFHHKLAPPMLSMVSLAIMQHRFSMADSLLKEAKNLGIRLYVYYNLSYDVAFELGHYQEAAYNLDQLKVYQDFNYYFRKSKQDHLDGKTDSALAAMDRAVVLAGHQHALKALALSNLGDLFLHANKPEKAVTAWKKALLLNPADLHSLLGLSLVALIHDADAVQAKRILHLVAQRNQLPEPFFRLYQLESWAHHASRAKYYAHEFAKRATDPKYGKMYSKYLIELYSGILQEPSLAERLAYAELADRATPQTHAWYAYALFINHKTKQALPIFDQYVSGQPLEAVELYYMGKLLKNAEHGFDAQNYLEKAADSPYDLSPAMLDDIEKLKE
ncbi:Tetratricopeptide repeat-containing protein [bacterium A37T11]|nr:Tetratricopeptide repeat-containing protein [bacterium A37T11]